MRLGLVAMVMAFAISNSAWADNCTDAKRADLSKAGHTRQVVDKICGAAASVSFTLDSPNLMHFYPNAQDATMPAYYTSKKGFPQTLQQSIEQFTQASLDRDNLLVTATVAVTATGATVTLSSDDSGALEKAKGYASMLPGFMSTAKAGLGWAGALQCQSATNGTTKCWDPATGKSPWAFYLPLGLPLVNQKTVMLLNYPPSDALCSGDYLSNFTMARWETVLKRVGITDPLLFENIVDVHPIAAPGSGQSSYIAGTTSYFLSRTPPNYDQDMLDLMLTVNAAGTSATTIPLQVAGSDALSAWATMTGQSAVTPGSVGTFSRTGGTATPWVATNHPDVTTYQMCKGDPSDDSVAVAAGHTTSTATVQYVDDQLVEDELMDLRAACTLKLLAANPGMAPEAAMAECKTEWCTDDNGKCRTQDVCIQARLDYDFTSQGQCKCEQAAAAFCSANGNNACPSTTSLTSCADFNATYCGGTPKQSYNTCTSLTPSTQAN